MSRINVTLILLLVVVSGLVGTGCKNKETYAAATAPRTIPAAERKAALKAWEATPEGVKFKKWEASPEGKKVYASEAKIREAISGYTNLEAVVTALALPPGSRLGYGVMVRIHGDDYILSLGTGVKNDFQQLRSLQVADRIIIRSHSVSHAPKYAYPIVSGDYVERNRKILYKRAPRKGGC